MFYKKTIIAPSLALLLATNLYAASYTVEDTNAIKAIEKISKLSNIPFIGDTSILNNIKTNKIEDVENIDEALKQMFEGTGIEATIEHDTIIIKKLSSVKVINGTYILDEISVKDNKENSYTRTQDNSATGMNLSLKETPQSVSIITKKRMEDQQLNNLVDVMKNTTGVYTQSTPGNTAEASFYSRGYKITKYQVDGAPSAFNTGYYFTGNENIDSAIYDSVSVVRGATGFLTGQGDPSGSINLVRKKPTKDFQASLEAQTGRWDKYRGVADIGGGFNEDGSIRGRFIAVHDQGGYFNSLLDKTSMTLYGVVEADLGDSTTISASWERIDSQNNASEGASRFFVNDGSDGTYIWRRVGFSNFDKYTWFQADWKKREQIRDNYTLALNHHINDSWKIDATYNYINDNRKIKDGGCDGWVNNDTCRESRFLNHENDQKIHTFDAKLNGTFDLFGQTHDLVIGANGKREKGTNSTIDEWGQGQGFSIINNKLSVVEPNWGNYTRNKGKSETNQYGTFISTKLNFTDDLSAILGGRYSEWETGTTTKRKADNFLPYLALSYDITDNLTTYVSYTEIFNPQSSKDRNGDYLDPETGFNYEVGLKGEWFDGRLNSSIALFQSGKDGLAVTDMNEQTGECYKYPGGGQWGCAMKAEDDTKNKGWEFEIAGEITPYWQVQAGFSSSILKDKNGKRLTSDAIPIRTANLFTTYKPISKLTLGGGVRWQSEIFDNTVKGYYIQAGYPEMVSEATQKDYYVVDLMANYEFNKNLSLLVNLNNALNKEYKTSFNTYSYGEERNWMATLKYKF
ncbi:TonB-dependent siderophore receptor [Aliarcobacter vitoriensis]|uniref:TonB-dependent siderophore receptor n=1 Tax=Aliarcobacter vitoriensis TaxID=2011099 RepID=UPI003AAD4D34